MRLFTLPSTLQVGTKEDAYKKSYLFIDICFGLFTINTAAVYISNYALRSILYLRLWKHGMSFNLLSTRRYLKQKLRAKVEHFLDSFLKHTGQIFHWRNSSRCKLCEILVCRCSWTVSSLSTFVFRAAQEEGRRLNQKTSLAESAKVAQVAEKEHLHAVPGPSGRQMSHKRATFGLPDVECWRDD